MRVDAVGEAECERFWLLAHTKIDAIHLEKSALGCQRFFETVPNSGLERRSLKTFLRVNMNVLKGEREQM